MPHYAKFIKNNINKKRNLDEGGAISLSANCSAIIQKNMPRKMQDLGSFTIPCTIGNLEFGKALCDSSASINLMPLSVVKRLSLGELTPTTMSLQIADRFIAQPEGILEDVLAKVRKFIFPFDYVVIDIQDKQIPLLLSRPFLATRETMIDVKKGKLTLRVGKEELYFSLNQCLKQHDVEQAHCMKNDSVNTICKKMNDDLMNENSFDDYTSSSLYDDNFEKEKIMAETVLSLNERNTENLSSEEKLQVEEKSSKGLVLKELPKHLKCAFLGKERLIRAKVG